MRAVSIADIKVDVVYGHFVLPSGIAALKVGRSLNRPVFCVVGESAFETHETKIRRTRLEHALKQFDGLIFNAPHTREFVAKRYGIEGAQSVVVLNGVDRRKFYFRERSECRDKLGLPKNETLVVFVGSFIKRKGPLRVLRACQRISPTPKTLFIGSGSDWPAGPDVLFAGPVEQELLPYYLGASDVFVLPTQSEGMPNAIMEALACEVEIVTSPIAPNVQMLGGDYPYFCDPMEESDIARKIEMAIRHPVHRKRRMFTLQERAQAIVDFMESRL